jgi:hypothetical protein
MHADPSPTASSGPWRYCRVSSAAAGSSSPSRKAGHDLVRRHREGAPPGGPQCAHGRHERVPARPDAAEHDGARSQGAEIDPDEALAHRAEFSGCAATPAAKFSP